MPSIVLQACSSCYMQQAMSVKGSPVSQGSDDQAARVAQVLIAIQGISINHAHHERFLHSTPPSVLLASGHTCVA